MTRARSAWSSTVGKKIAMAVTGVILIGFVFVHMIGNLKVYFGHEAFNHYAEGLRCAPWASPSSAMGSCSGSHASFFSSP
jgi:hypothetical protein